MGVSVVGRPSQAQSSTCLRSLSRPPSLPTTLASLRDELKRPFVAITMVHADEDGRVRLSQGIVEGSGVERIEHRIDFTQNSAKFLLLMPDFASFGTCSNGRVAVGEILHETK